MLCFVTYSPFVSASSSCLYLYCGASCFDLVSKCLKIFHFRLFYWWCLWENKAFQRLSKQLHLSSSAKMFIAGRGTSACQSTALTFSTVVKPTVMITCPETERQNDTKENVLLLTKHNILCKFSEYIWYIQLQFQGSSAPWIIQWIENVKCQTAMTL